MLAFSDSVKLCAALAASLSASLAFFTKPMGHQASSSLVGYLFNAFGFDFVP